MKTHTFYNNIAARLLVLLVAALILAPADAQNSRQYAIFNYRNDGNLNAWLNIDIDSITYSCIDTLGIEHDEVVVQEVWTPDSLYRIPIEAIDSIGFRAPASEFKPGIFVIEKMHMPYIVTADDGSVTFKKGTSSSMMPVKGQIMYSDLVDEPFYMGFAGRVVDIYNMSNGVKYVCEPVSPDEVYDRHLEVFKIVTDTTQVLDAKEMAHHAPRRLFGGIADDGTITIPDLKFSLNAALDKWAGCNGNVKIDGKVSNSVEYVICVGMGGTSFVDIKHTKKTSFSLSTSYKIDKYDTKDYSFDEWLDEPIYSVGCKYLGLNIYVGLFFDVDADLEFIAKFPVYKSSQVEEYYFGSDLGWTNPLVTTINNGGWSLSNDNVGDLIDDTEVKVKLGGSISFGPVIKASFQVWKPSFLSFDVRAKGGLELSGECSLDLLALVHGEDAVYNLLSDTKISTGLKVGIELHGNAKGKDCKFASASTTLFKTDHYLFPKFTQPLLPEWVNGGWESGLNPLSIYSVPSNNMLLPGKVGLAVFDEYGKRLSTTYGDVWFFGGNWEKSWLQSDISALEKEKTYVIRPFFRMLNIGEVLASPSTVVHIPQSMSLDTNNVTIQKNKAQWLAINGGWGEYSVFVLDKAVCSAELIQDGDSRYLQIVGLIDGRSTTVTLKDLRTEETKTVLVTVTNEPVSHNSIKVMQESINFGEVVVEASERRYLTIVNNGTELEDVNVKIGDPYLLSNYAGEYGGGGRWNNSLSFSLDPNSQKVVVVHFNPTAVGSYNSEITVTSNGIAGGKMVIPVYASVIVAQEDPSFHLSTNSIDVYVKDNKIVEIHNGSGDYDIINNYPDIVESDINGIHVAHMPQTREPGESGRPIKYDLWYVTGKKVGKAVLKVKDKQTNEVLTLNVEVKNAPSLSLSSRTVVLPVGEYDSSIEIKAGSGWYNITSENPEIATAERYDKNVSWVDENGEAHGGTFVEIKGVKSGSTKVMVKDMSSGETATINVTVTGDEEVHEYVDLGLPSGTLWATCNVGANNPEEYGSWFAWGETEPKTDDTSSEYKYGGFYNHYYFEVTKYCTDEHYGYNGFMDGLTELLPEDDAATINWGDAWLMPSKEQIKELIDNRYTFVEGNEEINGKWGWKITSRSNGNSIFLPLDTDFRDRYWSRSLREENPQYAYMLAGYTWGGETLSYNARTYYYLVRPVHVSQQGHVTNITLNETTLILKQGEQKKIIATVLPVEALNKSVIWKSNNENVATVDANGMVTAIHSGVCNITCYATDGSRVYSDCLISVYSALSIDGHEYVNLGLPSGTLWAIRNLGSESPIEFGDYFAWGETETKNKYDESNYKWMENGQLTKYTFADGQTDKCWYRDGVFIGDGLAELQPEDDAATVNWGNSWQMPSRVQFDELCDNTTHTWVTISGVEGDLFTGINGNSIFLPDEDNGTLFGGQHYWTRSLSTSNSEYALTNGWRSLARCYELHVRPVMRSNSKPDYQDGGNPSDGDGRPNTPGPDVDNPGDL